MMVPFGKLRACWAHHDSGRLVFAGIACVVLSACSDVASTVTEQVKGTVSGALVPLKESVEEVSRRANEVGEGIHEMRVGVQRVKGALSGSGSTW